VAQDEYTPAFIFDHSAAKEARRQRFARFQTVDVPKLRQIGFALNAVGVLLHNYLVYGHVTLRDGVFITSVLVGYAAFAWLTIGLLWDRIKIVDIADVFLIIDVFFLGFVVYVSGANTSLLWPVFLARPADQVATTFRRALFFAHLGPLAFFGLMFYVTGVEHREINWTVECAKGAFLYFMSIYIAATARTAEARRNKLADARRIAEQAVRHAEDKRRELETALTRLEDASKAKSEFLANVSHELRTPLNNVMGSSDLLLDTALTRDQREMVGVLRDSADSLTHIVNDILDLARVEARRMPLEQIPMRLRDVAGATLRMFTARVHNRPIELICRVERDVPDAVTGDPVRLRQVLTNLIGNAIKFTERGEIVLSVERDAVRDGRLGIRFSVRDTGIGIPKDRQAAIFDAFTQVDGSSTRKYGGTGLGLTIANELVALMDGRMWVDSEPGRGSTFSFVAWFAHGPANDAWPEAPWGTEPLHVLIAAAAEPRRRRSKRRWRSGPSLCARPAADTPRSSLRRSRTPAGRSTSPLSTCTCRASTRLRLPRGCAARRSACRVWCCCCAAANRRSTPSGPCHSGCSIS
jgi:signal transduction histidine kinase